MKPVSPLPDPVFCGCDADTPDSLVSVDEAIRVGLAMVVPVEEREDLALAAAHGRVLAMAQRAPAPLPPFDNSAMDGYALRLDDLAGEGPWNLPVAGAVAAGDSGLLDWPRGSALRILTGAPVPPDCDAIARQEDVRRLDKDEIRLRRPPAPGANIRRAGEDLPAGAPLLPAGRLIEARAAAVLAAAGIARVPARRRIRVATLSIGAELREPGEPLSPGQIWNANRYHLAGSLAQPWIETMDFGVVPDSLEALRVVMERAAWGADLVVSTGGVSVGDADHTRGALRAVGADVRELRLAMKPGKPLVLGRIGRSLFVGLPGNPVSAFVSWQVIGARLAEALAGIGRWRPRKMIVHAGFARDREPGLCEFLPARLTGYGVTGAPEAEVVTASISQRVALLAEADGLVLIPAETDRVAEGDLLEFIAFPEGI